MRMTATTTWVSPLQTGHPPYHPSTYPPALLSFAASDIPRRFPASQTPFVWSRTLLCTFTSERKANRAWGSTMIQSVILQRCGWHECFAFWLVPKQETLPTSTSSAFEDPGKKQSGGSSVAGRRQELWGWVFIWELAQKKPRDSAQLGNSSWNGRFCLLVHKSVFSSHILPMCRNTPTSVCTTNAVSSGSPVTTK